MNRSRTNAQCSLSLTPVLADVAVAKRDQFGGAVRFYSYDSMILSKIFYLRV